MRYYFIALLAINSAAIIYYTNYKAKYLLENSIRDYFVIAAISAICCGLLRALRRKTPIEHFEESDATPAASAEPVDISGVTSNLESISTNIAQLVDTMSSIDKKMDALQDEDDPDDDKAPAG